MSLQHNFSKVFITSDLQLVGTNTIKIEMLNHTKVTYFIIKGISDDPNLQLPIFLLVLFMYIITLGGNMTIFLLICMDRHLHTPMYFFLSNLSVMDMSSTTVTLHRILVKYVTGNGTITFFCCMTQVYFFSSITGDQLLLLTAMSYDRYAAICMALRYPLVMNSKTCCLLAIVCWMLGFLQVIPYIILLSSYTCYRSNSINHFYCDLVPVMKLSCSDTLALEILIFTEGLLLLNLTPCLLTFISYVFIIVTILRIQTKIGRRKAFYTCSSHLIVVLFLYITIGCQYLTPVSTNTVISYKLFSLFNTAAVPMVNPLIYSLRNNDVKSAFGRRVKYFRALI
ncbi:olfactory receptor 2AP1-like [Pelobates cultripes]|uniref:Olfactory receptor 2AP1-like n=1 Tax=Pelobates cultripes TaxID=61616 RepID=A0AAD1T2E9_PELCU|nr:olfactory receptor 2AP1-like [Pelobates cultripes]